MSEINKEELKQENPDAPKGQEEELKQEGNPAPDNQVDYKAELEKLSQERDNYKEGMLNAKDKLKKNKEEDDDAPSVKEQLEEMFDKKMSEFESKRTESKTEDIITSVSSNDDEKKLIQFHLENSIKRSGDDTKDVKLAKLAANQTKLYDENAELKAALSAKNSMTSSAGSNMDKPDYSPDVKLTPAESNLLERTNKNRARRGQTALTPEQFTQGV